MRKTSISQRWSSDFVEKTRVFARKAEISMTQLTIDAIELLGNLLDHDYLRKTSNDQRIKIIQEALANSSIPDQYKISTKQSIEHQIKQFLVQHPNTSFSTTQIANELSLVQSTVRSYVKRLSSHRNFTLFPGRPNRILYNSQDY